MEPSIGIDLGTTNSSVAISRGGVPRVLPTAEGKQCIPSVVAITEAKEVIVGYDTLEHLVRDPYNTIYSAKRLIGRQMDDPDTRLALASFPYAVVEGERGQPVVQVRGEKLRIPEVAAYILRALKRTAEQHLGGKVCKAVITVPANFNDAQRESTRIAGRIAGLDVIRIINEPAAAALAYAFGRGMAKTIAVYDFGGGSFDFTLLELRDNIFRVLATAGDIFLGGDDFDEALATAVANSFWKQSGIEIRNDVVEWQRLIFASEKVKRELSSRPQALLRVVRVANTARGSLDLSAKITRELFNSLCAQLVRRTFAVCDQALSDARLRPQDVDDVILAGGTTFIPLVRASVEQYFGKPPRVEVDPETAVALGAAIQAESLLAAAQPEPSARQAVLVDVLPHSISVVTPSGYVEQILHRNMPIPAEQTRTFATDEDGQREVRIRVVQGESARLQDNAPLGEMVVSGLRPAQRGEVRVQVCFEVDVNGILQLTAKDLDSGRVCKRSVKISGEISEAQIGEITLKPEAR